MNHQTRIAVLDDYQQAAEQFADWAAIKAKAALTIFHDHLDKEQEIIERLKPFEVICVMRERTPLTAGILDALPNLKLIVSTGMRNASIDTKAAEERNIAIRHTGYHESGAPELTWALLLAAARNLATETTNFKNRRWQTTMGTDLKGKTIGIVGLGRIGSKIAQYAKAFEMKVIAWSENLTEERAHRAGAELVTKERLFKQADFVTLHLVLSDRSRNTVTKNELDLMKPTAYLVNTSRGPLINEQDLIEALSNKTIKGAALDVYNKEPLPEDHPFRSLDNLTATSHIGYVTEDTYKLFYTDTVKALEAWLQENYSAD